MGLEAESRESEAGRKQESLRGRQAPTIVPWGQGPCTSKAASHPHRLRALQG